MMILKKKFVFLLFFSFSLIALMPNVTQAQRKLSTEPTNPNPQSLPRTITAPETSPNQDKEKEKGVGACDSTEGCKTLKSACESVGYIYDNRVCYQPKSKITVRTASNTLTASIPTNKDATCFNTTLCNALKARCHGSWQQTGPTSGHCHDRKKEVKS